MMDSMKAGTTAPGRLEGNELALLARQILLEKKAEAPVIVDVRGRSSVTDYHVIVSGFAAPHIKGLMNEVQHRLKERGIACYRCSGVPEDGWIALDYVDVVIHIFLPEIRDYYVLEELWADCPRVP